MSLQFTWHISQWTSAAYKESPNATRQDNVGYWQRSRTVLFNTWFQSGQICQRLHHVLSKACLCLVSSSSPLPCSLHNCSCFCSASSASLATSICFFWSRLKISDVLSSMTRLSHRATFCATFFGWNTTGCSLNSNLAETETALTGS